MIAPDILTGIEQGHGGVGVGIDAAQIRSFVRIAAITREGQGTGIASLEVMDRDARKMRGERPFLFTNLKDGVGLADLKAWISERMAAPAEIRAKLMSAGDAAARVRRHTHPH